MNRTLLTGLTFLLLGHAQATRSPVPGSSLPDAYARAGQRLTLTVPEVAGQTVNVGGLPATITSSNVTLTIPPGTPPGRTVVRFAGVADARVITTREIDILPAQGDGRVNDRRVQLTLNPALSTDRVNALLASLNGLGVIRQRETLPSPRTTGTANTRQGPSTSPCGGTLAELELNPGVTLEDALNTLLGAGDDLWYPDPIGTWDSPAYQATQATSTPGPLRPPTFHYSSAPIIPRNVLNIGSKATTLKGKGVTIAVLDTGFSSAIDTLHELPAARVLRPMNALNAFDPIGTYTNAGDFWEGHGTQVAILAAGAQHGIATQAQVLPIKVCAPGADNHAACTTRDVMRGLCLALNQVSAPQLVINLSLGGSVPINAIHATLNWAAAQGAVVVAAGGNQGLKGSPKEYPAAYAQGSGTQVSLPLLAVGSATPAAPNRWTYSGFSTKGTYLNVSAPGEALDIGHPYLYSGTSFAAPLVAGAAALVKSANLNTLPPPAAVKAFMLMPSRTLNYPGMTPMLNLSGY